MRENNRNYPQRRAAEIRRHQENQRGRHMILEIFLAGIALALVIDALSGLGE
jgi:hypothetical protein